MTSAFGLPDGRRSCRTPLQQQTDRICFAIKQLNAKSSSRALDDQPRRLPAGGPIVKPTGYCLRKTIPWGGRREKVPHPKIRSRCCKLNLPIGRHNKQRLLGSGRTRVTFGLVVRRIQRHGYMNDYGIRCSKLVDFFKRFFCQSGLWSRMKRLVAYLTDQSLQCNKNLTLPGVAQSQ